MFDSFLSPATLPASWVPWAAVPWLYTSDPQGEVYRLLSEDAVRLFSTPVIWYFVIGSKEYIYVCNLIEKFKWVCVCKQIWVKISVNIFLVNMNLINFSWEWLLKLLIKSTEKYAN